MRVLLLPVQISAMLPLRHLTRKQRRFVGPHRPIQSSRNSLLHYHQDQIVRSASIPRPHSSWEALSAQGKTPDQRHVALLMPSPPPTPPIDSLLYPSLRQGVAPSQNSSRAVSCGQHHGYRETGRYATLSPLSRAFRPAHTEYPRLTRAESCNHGYSRSVHSRVKSPVPPSVTYFSSCAPLEKTSSEQQRPHHATLLPRLSLTR